MPPKRKTRGTKRTAAKEVEEEEGVAEESMEVEEESAEEKSAEDDDKSAEEEEKVEDNKSEESVPEAVEESLEAVERAMEEAAVAEAAVVEAAEAAEPPVKRSKVAEDALKKIEEAKAKVVADEEAARKAKAAELARFWKAVRDDPSDFTGWTYLLQHVDSKNDVEAGREAFGQFLQRYPYCYGYWKKFSDFEKRNGDAARCMAVFEQGLQAIPLSTDLWIHFLNYRKSVSSDREDVRMTYESAVGRCGREWRSDKLWNDYIKWETEGGEPARVYGIYTRLLAVPTQGVSGQLEAASSLVASSPPSSLLPSTTFLKLRKEVLQTLTGTEGGGAEAAPGEDDAANLGSEGETTAIRAKMVEQLKEVYKPTEERVKLRWKYEEGIKRPYFHVKPLERGQLKNWQEYLDFMKGEMAKEGGDTSEVDLLYERCLIACALYEQFWLSYVSWWQEREDKEEGERREEVRRIFKRSSKHLPTKVDLHTKWATWEERCGEAGEACRVLEGLEEQHPGLVSITLHKLNLERRRGRLEEACRLYEAAISSSKGAVASDLAVKYSRFLRLRLADGAKAQQVLQAAADVDPTNPKLHLQQLVGRLVLVTVLVLVPVVVFVLDLVLFLVLVLVLVLRTPGPSPGPCTCHSPGPCPGPIPLPCPNPYPSGPGPGLLSLS